MVCDNGSHLRHSSHRPMAFVVQLRTPVYDNGSLQSGMISQFPYSSAKRVPDRPGRTTAPGGTRFTERVFARSRVSGCMDWETSISGSMRTRLQAHQGLQIQRRHHLQSLYIQRRSQPRPRCGCFAPLPPNTGRSSWYWMFSKNHTSPQVGIEVSSIAYDKP